MRPVPQIVAQTGVSADYLNEYFGKSMILDLDGMPGLSATLDENPINTYTQRYPPSEYETPVTPQNSAAIARLDALARQVNSRDFTAEGFRRILEEVDAIINARPDEGRG